MSITLKFKNSDERNVARDTSNKALPAVGRNVLWTDNIAFWKTYDSGNVLRFYRANIDTSATSCD